MPDLHMPFVPLYQDRRRDKKLGNAASRKYHTSRFHGSDREIEKYLSGLPYLKVHLCLKESLWHLHINLDIGNRRTSDQLIYLSGKKMLHPGIC